MSHRIRFLLVLMAIACLPAALSGDALIIAGGGFVGRWDTEIELANVSADPVEVVLSIGGLPLGAPCPPNCTTKFYTIAGRGTRRVLASDFIGSIYAGPQMIRVDTLPDGRPLPVVHARAFSSAEASQFAELPVFRESSIEAFNAQTLVFPGATKQPGVYSNLFLEAIGVSSGRGEVLVEAFGPDGAALGSAHYIVPGKTTFSAFILVDVAASLGVSSLENGQIRVTKLSGDGVLWGVLTTVTGTHSLEVAVGAHP